MLIAKEKLKPRGEPEMKMAEFIESTRQVEAQYANRIVGLYELRGNILDAVEEGYVDGITVGEVKNDRLVVTCEDGKVIITKRGGLHFETIANRPRRSAYVRPMGHYERTRAMVYATGNKWAIENFEATHC